MGGFEGSSKNRNLLNSRLYADLNIGDNRGFQQNVIDLDHWVAVNAGNLVWQREGKFSSNSDIEELQLVEEDKKCFLKCKIKGVWSKLHLGAKIGNDHGRFTVETM
ncbi:hypothetical protein BDZ91DRAFT_751459 [Kalaharituber pfeilii]|nr:hypothetical protein BDZ91DRAFT_751459 [Kalaharituber pfeilii]